MNKESDKKVYTCPMHPDIKEDAPGRCPKCGMNLVEADDVSTGAGMGTNRPADTADKNRPNV